MGAMTTPQTGNPWPKRIGLVLSVLPCLLLLFSAWMKLSPDPEVVKQFVEHHGFPESAILPIGVVELLATILYLVPATAVLGAILLTGYLGGATAVHVRLDEPFMTAVLLGVILWGGLYLRDPRLRALIPLRR